MYNDFLIPANTKKSILIFGFLRPLDAIILGTGILVSVILLLITSNMGTLPLILSCIPMLLAVGLVLPIPNYHNVLVVIQSILSFYQERRNYYWKGWCIYDEFKDNK